MRAYVLVAITTCVATAFYPCGGVSNLWAQAPQLDQTGATHRAIGTIAADRHVPDSALDVHRRALSMAASDRYEYLSAWVLPGASHDTFRVALDFTPTHPAPPVSEHDAIDEMRIEFAQRRGETRVQTGGNLISPALDLIAVAKELGQVEVVRARIKAVVPRRKSQERARLSLLVLTDLASGDFDSALRNLDALYSLMEDNDDINTGRSPELLAIDAATAHSQTRGSARDAAMHLLMRDVRLPNRGSARFAWESHLTAIIAATRDLDRPVDKSGAASNGESEMSLAPRLTQWSPASRTTAASRGLGHPRSHWQRVDERIENIHSHKDDFFYYHIPLQGNFQVECDLQNKDYQNTQMIVGGHWAEPLHYSRGEYGFGDLRERLGRRKVDPILPNYDHWVHSTIMVADGVVTHYVNGRMLQRVEVQGEMDPWIVLRSDEHYDGSARDIRITGEPVIPSELRLTATDDLGGWFPYFPGQVGKPNATWQQLGDLPAGGGIVAPHRRELAGMNVERLLRYHRPMFEDGTIECDFFYRAGATHAHPALDRLAFLLEPDGVRIHWLTDGEFDRTQLEAGNAFEEPAQRRGPSKLPLVENDWNRLRLTLEGDSVSLYLNDQLVYQRDLEITNQRTFGLFYFNDRTDLRVRNVRWRGNWPRELPPVAKQELASHKEELLDERLPALTAVVQHDFAREGIPSDKVTIVTAPDQTIEQVAEGVRVRRPSGPGYVQTSLNFNLGISGDFDVVAAFEGFDPRPGTEGTSTAGLRMVMSPVDTQQCILLRQFARVRQQEDRHIALAIGRNRTSEADLSWKTFYSDAYEANSGRLRVARRGDRVFYLLAEGNSPNFRLVGETQTTSDPLPNQCVTLYAQAAGEGEMQVIWKEAVIRAEKLTSSPSAQSTLSVMNHDGTNVRPLLPKESGIVGPGSPAWSPDGKLIAFDVYKGSNDNCHLYVVNSDGSNLRHLGIGNMPTFSPDSKRMAFSWGAGGITIMDVDGTNREVLDSNGWGTQWSPDGRIAFGRGGNIVIYDPQTKLQREVLEGEQASRYAYVYWNMGWSRDGKHICFRAGTGNEDQFEIAVAAVAGSQQEFQVLHTSPQRVNGDFSWHPDGNRILFSMRAEEGLRLFLLDRQNPRPPVLFPGHPPNHLIAAADWSRDGQQIVFVSRVLPDWNWVAPPAAAK